MQEGIRIGGPARDVEAYYDSIADNYDERGYTLEGSDYPANFYRLELAKQIAQRLPFRSRILDAGCGTGQLLATLTELGHECAGTDLSGAMLNKARIRLRELGRADIELVQTPLDDLTAFPSDSFDHVFCLGVFPYIPEEVEPSCYQELRRVLRSGGLFVTAHENELFDLFTFNKYTLRFFERNIFPLLLQHDSSVELAELRAQLATLITNPTEPVNRDRGRSGRDIIFTKPENPLTYAAKLDRFGFRQEDILYYHFHALPPLVRNGNPNLEATSKRLELEEAKAWQGMFLASTFLSVARAA